LAYRRVLLAYDGTAQGRSALREGALLARRFRAKVFLLSVVAETPGLRIAEGQHPGAVSQHLESFRGVLEIGVANLRRLGLEPESRLVIGEPSVEIAAYARQIKADLVVVSHRKQSLVERWWLGASGGYLVDHIACSLLISRLHIDDAQFEAELRRIEAEEQSAKDSALESGGIA
jgi:nucleotide-binding universal stress UspA family protein